MAGRIAYLVCNQADLANAVVLLGKQPPANRPDVDTAYLIYVNDNPALSVTWAKIDATSAAAFASYKASITPAPG